MSNLRANQNGFLSTMRIKQHDRSKKTTCDIRENIKFLADSFVAHTIPIYKSLLSNIRFQTKSRASRIKNWKNDFGKNF